MSQRLSTQLSGFVFALFMTAATLSSLQVLAAREAAEAMSEQMVVVVGHRQHNG